jgi:hypothetical protein
MNPPDDLHREEVKLTGGFFSEVVRVGDTVRRSTGPWTPAAHALLRHLEEVGFEGAPRVLGIDEQGREVLSYVRGNVHLRATPGTMTEEVLGELGGLLRSYHEAVAGFELPSGIAWYYEPVFGRGALVCHNDLSPKNTVFREGRPVAFLDWDLASPAPPAWDLAHAAWQFVPLSDDRGTARHGWFKPPDRHRRLRILCDGYGLSGEYRRTLTRVVTERMEATASGLESLAADGITAYERLVQQGVPALVRVDKSWVKRHAGGLTAALVEDRPHAK